MNFELGLDQIDRKYGVNSGSIICLTYPMKSNGERLSHQILSKNTDDFSRSLYITTNKNKSIIRSILDNSEVMQITPDILDVSTSETRHSDILDEIEDVSKSLVVIDIVDILEDTNKQEYREFINSLSKIAKTADNTIVLNSSPTDNINRSYTKDISDVVLEIELDESSRSEIKPVIKLYKNRHTSYSDFSDKLWAIRFNDDSVAIDTSRGIA